MSKPALVLLHGVTMSGRVWDRVVPLLTDQYDVRTPTALGHKGGPPALQRPALIRHLVDAAERMLDESELERPHLAGNSLGGWMAIELARRGRAASVCALSPAGFWDAGSHSQADGVARLRREVALSRFTRPVAPLFLKSAKVRRLAMRDIAERADRLTADEALAAVDDLLGCAVTTDLLGTRESVAPLDPLPCPVTLAWAEHDAIFPPAVNGAIARERLPGATFHVLPVVGHVPMIDDPKLVAKTIAAATRSA
ncbi:alpha/beta fold hydrolase [Hoyosella subflava]|uniref:Putative hydrolase n=1 Tax=Hoyosella subflava (strain DSM 45089 / JCM 17490 / NBRC 109087 / DQS3-9A1) TaxID=443218 RepID=F6EKZ1_HOYSD|nr:alpha/beta hydrolase [Hoyosella subflava]AEF41471.1 Putative hydrolase [Hoyosella subflava DQS3-9A1]